MEISFVCIKSFWKTTSSFSSTQFAPNILFALYVKLQWVNYPWIYPFQTHPPHYNQSYLSKKQILCKTAFKITQLASKIYKLSIFIMWLLIDSLPVSSIYSANIWVSTLCYCNIVIISLSLVTVVKKMGMSPPSWSTLLAQQTDTKQWLCPYKSDQGYERKLRNLHAKKWFWLQYEKCLKYIKTKSI